jgi:membrane protein YdbS with pleckstrin-like domain
MSVKVEMRVRWKTSIITSVGLIAVIIWAPWVFVKGQAICLLTIVVSCMFYPLFERTGWPLSWFVRDDDEV